MNPDVEEGHNVRAWYDTQGGQINVSPLTQSRSMNRDNGDGDFQRGDGNTMFNKNVERKSFGQIKSEGLGRFESHSSFMFNFNIRSGSNSVFETKGTISLVKHENNIWYNACPEPKCNKKVIEENGQWKCEKCNKYFPTSDKR